ncbi:hypothetical protein PHLCEN_2v131 [Hermanssonia centrifuga]|uniref:Uncharacterized protein n=1 Tax=Hermanssonia centrifuga TaxID=98765 RepID=A0A2R6S6Z4_9APHY|nr:hypothetical protein PHLCEN_2v131 [Hermanssonia centrifuga]
MDSVVIYSANGAQTNPESPIVSADVPAGTDASGGQLPGNNEADHNDGNGEINNANSAPAVTTKQSISKSVLIGIIAACVIGFLSLLAIIMFVVTQIRRRRHEKASGQELESPVLPMQNPDLEAGGGDFSNEKSASKLSRSNSRFTMMSRWSQASFISGKPRDHEPAPPVPPVPFVPSIAPQMNMPVPPSQRAPSTWNASGRSSPAPSIPEDDGRSEVVDDYYYRNSTASVAPLRPIRPPGLDLRDLGPAFDHVPL